MAPQIVSTPAGAPGECRAILEVGTNSVKLLVARVGGDEVVPLLERSEQTRLGAGMFAHHLLSPAAIARTVTAAQSLCREAQVYKPAALRAVATAAAREASNRDELLKALRQACGLEVEVISGEDEANLAFGGVCSDARYANQPVLVADVGGGSTEFSLGSGGRRQFSLSLALGAVRLYEALRLNDRSGPEDLERCREFLDAFLESNVSDALRVAEKSTGILGGRVFVGVGGTVVILARIQGALDTFDRGQIEGIELTRPAVSALTQRLWSMPLAERRRLPGLPPERADIILTGAAIFEAIMRTQNLPTLRPSARGLRFALLLSS